MPAPTGLFKTDPLVSQNFFLEIDGKVVSMLTSVSGLDMEIAVSELDQGVPKGESQSVKTASKPQSPPNLTLVRMASVDADSDELWQWFVEVRDKGLTAKGGGSRRKNGSVVLFDSTGKEVTRFNFYDAWPQRISTDQLSVDSSEPVKETVTLVIERLERKFANKPS